MKPAQIHQFVKQYLEATQCHVIEQSPAHLTVKLSPQADKMLTNRAYYWGFVERTGVEPETMSFTFVCDPEAYQAKKEQKSTASPSPSRTRNDAKPQAAPAGDSILARYFGSAPPAPPAFGQRILEEQLTYGSGRLHQIFQTTKEHGKYVNLFEQPVQSALQPFHPTGYYSYLSVNFKVELLCDMKRSEIHSLGISLSTGELLEDFLPRISAVQLTPKLPPNTHLRQAISLPRAWQELEKHLERKLGGYDHSWAEEAHDRLNEELERVHTYYKELLGSTEEEQREAVQSEYEMRIHEMQWQYKPRIQVSVINCGIFHLLTEQTGINR